MTTKEFAKPNIGFIGMGHMGSHIALRLLASGYSLTVYDRTGKNTTAVRMVRMSLQRHGP